MRDFRLLLLRGKGLRSSEMLRYVTSERSGGLILCSVKMNLRDLILCVFYGTFV